MSLFDYIVVGGGSSGCAITHRLTESGARVLMLEDGPPDDSIFIHMPATFVRVIGSKRSVIYESEPQPEANNRKVYVPQGRTLGGGSSINAMIYIRGQKEDYDEWERQGCEGWGWENVLAAFKRSENHMRLSAPFHGNNGPLRVSDTRYRHPLSLAFVKAGQQVGIPYNDDFNGAHQDGIGFYHTTTFNGRRGSTAATYLSAVKDRSNLTVRTGCYVHKVIFDENKRAVGIELRNETGKQEVISVSKEVILAAGALSTPKILMLSGVGPKEHLVEHNIPVIHDAPEVGQNYQDHLEVSVYARTKKPISLLGNDKGLKALKHGLQWSIYKTGLLTSNVVESGGFVDTTGQGGRPDIQFHVIPTLMGDVDREPIEGHGLSINPCFLRPKSRGVAKLRSSDPMDPMVFKSGALSHQDDVDTLVRGVKLARKILRAPAFEGLIEKELRPSPNDDISDADIEAHVRSHAKTVYHPVGTCRMGGDQTAVVDTKLRVNGVTGLRICDASIMPTLVSGNTNAPTIMIGERCAEFILNQ